MKRTLFLLFISFIRLFSMSVDTTAISRLQKIGSMVHSSIKDNRLSISCEDKSELEITFINIDTVRVRVSLGKSLEKIDHSWAISASQNKLPKVKTKETKEHLYFSTSELLVDITKAPFLISFKDKNGLSIQSDHSPLRYNPDTGQILSLKKLHLNEHFYGLGEKATRLDKRRGKFINWNSDTPGYVEGRDPIYQSVPFYIGLDNGRAYGLFFDNSHKTEFDFGSVTQEYVSFSAEGGEMNYYFFAGPSFKKIVSNYTELTGRLPLPPLWALGNQQSRWSYYPDTLVEEVVDNYKKNDLPLDVIYLDIDYMNEYRDFTWDMKRFPNPKALIEKLKAKGIKTVVIVDPGVKYQPPTETIEPLKNPELQPQDKSYYVYNEGIKNDYFLKKKNGEIYIGKVWPGESVFPDFTNAGVRNWWGELHKSYTNNGVAGIWNDMNEPADFVDQTGETQKDIVYDDMGQKTYHGKNRNVYGMLMSQATYEGLEKLRPNERPYVITRAGYAGVQRYATMWTGDNTSTWESLKLSLPMFMSLGISGESFVGSDMGGFMSGRANGELMARWYQVGFLTPFCRNHRIREGYDHEPFRYPKYYQDIFRKYLKLRYRLLPYLYTTLHTAHATGIPLVRPLVLEFQEDSDTVDLDDQYMLGDSLLAAPILENGRNDRLIYFPKGDWIDFWTRETLTGPLSIRKNIPLENTALYVKAGSILPMGPEQNYIGENTTPNLDLVLFPDKKQSAALTLYEDDGHSQDYKKDIRRTTEISYLKSKGRSVVEFKPSGKYKVPARKVQIILKINLPKQVLLDKKVIPKGVNGQQGWQYKNGELIIFFQDDNSIHQLTF